MKTDEKKKTLGQQIIDNYKPDDYLVPVLDIAEASSEKRAQAVIDCINKWKDIIQEPFFYIEGQLKRERLYNGQVYRWLIGAKRACPTPQFDQTVYFYRKQDEHLELVWVTPDRNTANYLRDNALEVVPSEKQLLNYVLDFFDGTLDKIAKTRNGEIRDEKVALIIKENK